MNLLLRSLHTVVLFPFVGLAFAASAAGIQANITGGPADTIEVSAAAGVPVTLSASPSINLVAVWSRKTHLGVGSFDLPIDTTQTGSGLPTVEPRAIGAGHAIIFEFNVPVSSLGTATATDVTSGTAGSVSASISGNEVVVSLAGIADNRRIAITLTSVTGPIDSTDATASIGFLTGDVNNSRSVNAADISALRANVGKTVDGITYKFDLNADGAITQGDVSAAKARSGLMLPLFSVPAITSAVPPNGLTDIIYTHQFTSNLAVTAWSASPTPPAWLTLNPNTGLLSGTPAAGNAGNISFTVSAATVNGPATQAVTFSVTAPIAPTFTSAAPPAGTAGTPYSFAFTASGTPAPTFTLVTPNTQPTGLTLSSSGVLSGTPTNAGTYMFAVQAANSAGAVVSPATGTHSVVIGAAPVPTGAIVADIEGNAIPMPVSRGAKEVLAIHPGPNGGGNYPGAEIRGWAANPARCTNTQPAITNLWYHNINILDYGMQSTIDYFDFAPNQAVAYGFVPAPPAANNSQVGTIFVTTGPLGTPAPTFVSISTSPCDFDVAKVAAADKCYTTATSENGFTFQITTNPTSPVCKLTPGVQYYLNLRFQDARPLPDGTPTTDACATQLATRPGYSTCGAMMKIQTF